MPTLRPVHSIPCFLFAVHLFILEKTNLGLYPAFASNMSLAARGTEREAEPFTYTPLDLSQRSIRLLRIHPSLSSAYIRCEIRGATVDDDYTCLSYVWGPPDKGYPVLINEHLYKVRGNLWDFLLRARRKEFGWLWVDALCIDQEKSEEADAPGAADG